jgi:hypothetical protein
MLSRMFRWLRDEERSLYTLILQLKAELMDSLQTLQAEVTDVKSVMASAVTLINGFSSRLDAAIAAAKAGDNSAALDQLSADLKSSADALAAAVAANTPAAPAPAPDPVPAPAPADPAPAPAPGTDG